MDENCWNRKIKEFQKEKQRFIRRKLFRTTMKEQQSEEEPNQSEPRKHAALHVSESAGRNRDKEETAARRHDSRRRRRTDTESINERPAGDAASAERSQQVCAWTAPRRESSQSENRAPGGVRQGAGPDGFSDVSVLIFVSRSYCD